MPSRATGSYGARPRHASARPGLARVPAPEFQAYIVGIVGRAIAVGRVDEIAITALVSETGGRILGQAGESVLASFMARVAHSAAVFTKISMTALTAMGEFAMHRAGCGTGMGRAGKSRMPRTARKACVSRATGA